MTTTVAILATVSISLFILKIIVDSIKTYIKNSRVLDSASTLIAEEIKDNYNSAIEYIELVKTTRDIQREKSYTPIDVNEGKSGCIFISVKDRMNEKNYLLPEFSTMAYDKYIQIIAELNKKNFNKVQDAYSVIRDLIGHKHKWLMELDGSRYKTGLILHRRRSLIGFLPKEKHYYKKLKIGYKALTNCNIDEDVEIPEVNKGNGGDKK